MSRQKISPPFLAEGDEVALISPSWAIDEDKIQSAVVLLESWGLKVHIGENVLRKSGPFAGTDEERLSDLQSVTDERRVKAVFCSRGGYGMLRIIDRVDFTALKRAPKWFVGFSDITVLHLWLSEVCKVVSVHGEMPLHFSGCDRTEATFSSLHDSLFGEYKPVRWEGHVINPGEARGEVIGGNISLISSLMGTKAEPVTRGRILFIEDVGEYYHHLDRMMTSLRLGGKLRGLAALLVGGLTDMIDTKVPWAGDVEQIISDAVTGYDYPVFHGFPAGHINDNRAFYIGKTATVRQEGSESVLIYDP